MNTQFRKGVIEMCVLALIDRKDMYGYEIVQSIAFYTEINEGTVYPILRRLEAAGCLTVYSVEHNGRLRKFYRITEGGLKQIDAFLEGWTEIQRVYEFVKECAGDDAERVSQ